LPAHRHADAILKVTRRKWSISDGIMIGGKINDWSDHQSFTHDPHKSGHLGPTIFHSILVNLKEATRPPAFPTISEAKGRRQTAFSCQGASRPDSVPAHRPRLFRSMMMMKNMNPPRFNEIN
jgi:hypothetical protein